MSIAPFLALTTQTPTPPPRSTLTAAEQEPDLAPPRRAAELGAIVERYGSKAAAARALGCKFAALWRYLNGRRRVPPDVLARAAALLAAPPPPPPPAKPAPAPKREDPKPRPKLGIWPDLDAIVERYGSQTKAAPELGCSQQVLSDYLGGRLRPPPDVLARAAALLGKEPVPVPAAQRRERPPRGASSAGGPPPGMRGIDLTARMTGDPPWPDPSAPCGQLAADAVRAIVLAMIAKWTPKGLDPGDVVQEVCLAIVRKNQQDSAWDPARASFSKYVMLVTRSTISNMLDKERRHDIDSLDAWETPADEHREMGHDVTPEALLEAELAVEERIAGMLRGEEEPRASRPPGADIIDAIVGRLGGQAATARALGCTQAAISRYTSGRRKPPPDVLARAEALLASSAPAPTPPPAPKAPPTTPARTAAPPAAVPSAERFTTVDIGVVVLPAYRVEGRAVVQIRAVCAALGVRAAPEIEGQTTAGRAVLATIPGLPRGEVACIEVTRLHEWLGGEPLAPQGGCAAPGRPERAARAPGAGPVAPRLVRVHDAPGSA